MANPSNANPLNIGHHNDIQQAVKIDWKDQINHFSPEIKQKISQNFYRLDDQSQIQPIINILNFQYAKGHILDVYSYIGSLINSANQNKLNPLPSTEIKPIYPIQQNNNKDRSLSVVKPILNNDNQIFNRNDPSTFKTYPLWDKVVDKLKTLVNKDCFVNEIQTIKTHLSGEILILLVPNMFVLQNIQKNFKQIKSQIPLKQVELILGG
jgi:hypothetical protein